MRLLVASVHHTGTMLVFDDILAGFPIIDPQDHSEHEWGKVQIHLEERFLEDLEWWLKRVPTIVPLRHPREVAIGWKVRAKRREELGEQWKLLKEVIDPYQPHYLPVDSLNKDMWLQKIARVESLILATNWPVIGRCDDPRPELDDKDEFLVRSWMEDGFFERFGYT